MSKGLRQGLGIAASIFIPMAAPWMASVLTGASSIAGLGAGGKALAAGIGAVGGGAGARAAGGDWRQGALGGALTGGILAATGKGLFGGGTAAAAPAPAGASVNAPITPSAPQPSFLSRMGDAFTTAAPQMVVQGGLGIAGAREEGKLIAEQQRQNEMQNAAERAQFDRQMQMSEEMRAQAAQFDPQRAGLEQAGMYQRQLANQQQEALRRMGGQSSQAQREAVRRQFDIAGSLGRGTSYAQGSQQAGAQQRATLQTAAGMTPGVPKRAGLDFSTISSIGDYTGGRTRAAGAVLEPYTAALTDSIKKKKQNQTQTDDEAAY
jgi:hypothetical protein